MKKFFFFLCFPLMTLSYSCGSETDEGSEQGKIEPPDLDTIPGASNTVTKVEKIAEPHELTLDKKVDMTTIDMNLIIEAPSEAEIVQKDSRIYLRKDDTYSVEVIKDNDLSYTLEDVKRYWKRKKDLKFKRYILNDNNGAIAELEKDEIPQYHFFYAKDGEYDRFVFRNDTTYTFTLAQTKEMYNSVKKAYDVPDLD